MCFPVNFAKFLRIPFLTEHLLLLLLLEIIIISTASKDFLLDVTIVTETKLDDSFPEAQFCPRRLFCHIQVR